MKCCFGARLRSKTQPQRWTHVALLQLVLRTQSRSNSHSLPVPIIADTFMFDRHLAMPNSAADNTVAAEPPTSITYRAKSHAMKHLLPLICASLFLVGCSTNIPVGAAVGARPDPATSEFLRTKGGGFAVNLDDNRKPESCRFSLLLTPVKSLVSPLYLQARFENPLGGAPLVADAVLQPGDREVLLTSPPVSGLRTRKVYRVDVAVYSDAARTQQVSTHTQYVQSFIDL